MIEDEKESEYGEAEDDADDEGARIDGEDAAKKVGAEAEKRAMAESP